MTDNDRLIDELTASGALPARWRSAFEAVPRHWFIPEHVWDDDEQPVVRDDEPARWWQLAYADAPIVTQLDEGAEPTNGRRREVTSSISMPSVVADMLANLDPHPGMTVLEIGTGSGYNTALLSAHVGDRNITSIDIDPALTERAAKTLAEAGWRPDIITGDGAAGHPPRAPYDRVLSTAAVRHVPYPWVAQTRPGGQILFPYGTGYLNGAQMLLTAHDDGTATGRVVGSCAFMRLRQQRLPFGWIDDFVTDEEGARPSVTTVDLAEARTVDAGLFIGAAVPDIHATVGGSGDEWTLWLFDHAGSWAAADHDMTASEYAVQQYGPRRLWDEVETAYRQWVDLDRPRYDRYGFTVTPDRQHIWLDHPELLSWDLPATSE